VPLSESPAAVPVVFGTLALWSFAICRAAGAAERSATAPGPGGRPPYELAVAVAILATAMRPPLEALTIGVVCIALVAAAPADGRTGLLFDAVTRPTTLLVLALSTVGGRAELATIGVCCVAGFFAALVAVSRGAWIGLGDVKAIFALAAAFGAIEATLAVFVACCSGIATATIRPPAGDVRTLAFGPHLAVGACATLACGPYVERIWMHLT